jgi:hypothetical protein
VSIVTDPLVAAARFLTSQLEWLRHAVDAQGEPYAVTAYAEIAHCAGRLRGLVNGPSEQRYLGPCRSKVGWDDAGNEFERDEPCEGNVFVPLGGEKGTCRTCGARWAAADRREWLDGEVRAHAFRASEIEQAYGINANLIRQWATPARGLVQVHGHDIEGRALYLLSHVLDVAAIQAAKRAEIQAKRARSQATRRQEDAA